MGFSRLGNNRSTGFVLLSQPANTRRVSPRTCISPFSTHQGHVEKSRFTPSTSETRHKMAYQEKQWMKVLSQRPLTGCYCGNGRPLGRPPPLGVTLPFLLFIRAHFLICFIALLVVRIVQHLMGKNELSAERIARALNAATCRVYFQKIATFEEDQNAGITNKAQRHKRLFLILRVRPACQSP